MKVCRRCGYQNTDDAKICANCFVDLHCTRVNLGAFTGTTEDTKRIGEEERSRHGKNDISPDENSSTRQDTFLNYLIAFTPSETLSKTQFVLLSLIPAILLLLSEAMLRKDGYPYTPGVAKQNSQIYCLVPGAALPIAAAFIVGLFFPLFKR